MLMTLSFFFSPLSIARFRQRLNICSVYGVDFHVEYDANKSTVMTCRAKKGKFLCQTSFFLIKINIWDASLQITRLITIKCIDSAVIYAQANMLLRKLFSCCKDYSL